MPPPFTSAGPEGYIAWMPSAALAIATWNLHRARGADGRVDPARVAAAITGAPALAGADVLVLTEAEAETPPHARLLHLPAIEAATGLRAGHAEAMRWGPESDGFLGTILMLRPPLVLAWGAVVDLPGVYPRAAVVAEVGGLGAPLRIVATHLSLVQVLRMAQMRTLAQALARRPAMTTILVGDLNEWRPWGGLAFGRRVAGRGFTGPARATFPARLPLLPLDRIMADRPGMITEARALRGRAFVDASDHLPLVARITLS